MQDAEPPPDAIEVVAVGHQHTGGNTGYPKLGVVTANELHVPVSDRGAADADLLDAVVGGQRSQLLDSAPGRQDRPRSRTAST